jgi:hypothetical protein
MVRGGIEDDTNGGTEDGTDYGREDYMGDGIGDDNMWKCAFNQLFYASKLY